MSLYTNVQINTPRNTRWYGVFDDSGTWTQAITGSEAFAQLLEVPSTSGLYTAYVYFDGEVLPPIDNMLFFDSEWTATDLGLDTGILTVISDAYTTLTIPMSGFVEPSPSVTLRYQASQGGSIQGELVQFKPENSEGSPVLAIPDEGFLFYRWSDGNTSPSRQDTVKEITYVAYFIDSTRSTKLVYDQYKRPFEGEPEETVTYWVDRDFLYFKDAHGNLFIV